MSSSSLFFKYFSSVICVFDFLAARLFLNNDTLLSIQIIFAMYKNL